MTRQIRQIAVAIRDVLGDARCLPEKLAHSHRPGRVKHGVEVRDDAFTRSSRWRGPPAATLSATKLTPWHDPSLRRANPRHSDTLGTIPGPSPYFTQWCLEKQQLFETRDITF